MVYDLVVRSLILFTKGLGCTSCCCADVLGRITTAFEGELWCKKCAPRSIARLVPFGRLPELRFALQTWGLLRRRVPVSNFIPRSTLRQALVMGMNVDEENVVARLIVVGPDWRDPVILLLASASTANQGIVPTSAVHNAQHGFKSRPCDIVCFFPGAVRSITEP